MQVWIEGTNQGSLTNAEGRYQIVGVQAGQVTVRVQSIGFGTVGQTVNVLSGERVTVDFALEEQVLAMDEIVVTGTAGQARRREIGNTISQISSRELDAMPIRNLGDVLQGRIAGGVISDASGQVGAGRAIRLRGVNSLTMANIPLVYVDGGRINSDPFNAAPGVNNAASPLNSLNPDDIDRVEIIKGAAASTLYGTEASSGVIQIFTKRGSRGEPEWSLKVSQGVNNMGHVGPREDPTGLWFNDCTMFPGCPARGSWLRNGHVQKYNLSVQGGAAALSYFLSGRWAKEEGVLDLQHSTDWSLRGNFGFAASPTLNIQFTSAYAHSGIRWLEEGNNAQGLVTSIIRGPAGLSPNVDHSYHFDRQVWTYLDQLTSGVNVLWIPTTWMTHRVNAGLDLSGSESSRERPWGDPLLRGGDRSVNTEDRRRLSFDYAGTLTHSFGQNVSSSSSWGAQLYERFNKGVDGYGRDFAGPGTKVIGSGAVTSSSEGHIRMVSGGVFLEQTLGWQDRLFVTGGVRWDGFSTFGEGL
ncbi:MAG: TonB-dependent receptor plug domain-containing protein, partial [Longimicrobiales bacterium]|nr:TonB-dependent receptor plug domain-containing protein [Longimicrobiales bacterium]